MHNATFHARDFKLLSLFKRHQVQCPCSSNSKLNSTSLICYSDIMLKEYVAAVLFIALISGVTGQTPITISAEDKDEIVEAHNFVRRGVMPPAANMEVMVSYH